MRLVRRVTELGALAVTESVMFSTWTKRRKVIAALSVTVLAFVAFSALIIIDGDAYDRWRHAHHLRVTYQAWVRDGSPEPPQIERYVGPSRSSTTFVYTASLVIDDQTYQGLFAHRTTRYSGTFVITRAGEILVIDESRRARLLRIHRTRAAAW